MAELIRKEDTLNQGREKLNEAIKDAELADVKATQALAKSESTQTQLDTIVINGDSSVEAAQARVSSTGTAYGTLKQRLDSEYQEVTTQLAQIENQKIDEVVQDGSIVSFKSNGRILTNFDLSVTANASLVQDYIDTLVSNGQITGVTLEDNSIEFSKLSNGLTDTLLTLYTKYPYDVKWELGSINGQTGENSLDGTNQRSDLIVVNEYLQVEFLFGDFDYIIYYYLKDGTYSHRTYEKMGRINEGKFIIGSEYNIRLLVHAKDGTNMTGREYQFDPLVIVNQLTLKNLEETSDSLNHYQKRMQSGRGYNAYDKNGKNLKINQLFPISQTQLPSGTTMYQSLAYDGQNIYVLYQNGVVQKYKEDGTHIQTVTGLTLGKPNDSTYYNGYIYCRNAFTFDETSASATITKVNPNDWTTSNITFSLPANHHVAGVDIVGGIVYFASQVDVFPLTKYYIDSFDLTTQAFIKTVEVNVGHEFGGIQGFYHFGDLVYCVNSPYDSSKSSKVGSGLYLDISTKNGETLNTITSSSYSEPEGIYVVEVDNVIYAVVGQAGLYGVNVLQLS